MSFLLYILSRSTARSTASPSRPFVHPTLWGGDEWVTVECCLNGRGLVHLQGSPIVTVLRKLDSQVTRGEVRTCGRDSSDGKGALNFSQLQVPPAGDAGEGALAGDCSGGGEADGCGSE